MTASYIASDLTMAFSNGGETSLDITMHAAAIAASVLRLCTNAFAAALRSPAPLSRAMMDCIPMLKPNPIMYIARNLYRPEPMRPVRFVPRARNRASVMFISCSTRMLIMTGRLMSHIFPYVFHDVCLKWPRAAFRTDVQCVALVENLLSDCGYGETCRRDFCSSTRLGAGSYPQICHFICDMRYIDGKDMK